jgi:serine/threonine protein phosphatase PrpC
VTVLRSGSATDVGKVRKVNQDLPLETANLYAVADGMGGHVGGEVAAQVAVDALLQAFSREPTRGGLEEAFSTANSAVWQESQDNPDLRGMGTTLTAAALVTGSDGRDVLALANVGDSRAYLFSNGGIVQITADHSLAEERMRHGEMTQAEAAVHPQRHILTRALGVSTYVETDMWELQLRSGDRLILCSDGLSNEVSREELAEVLATVRDPGDAARKLVDMANDHGGPDNITVVVVDVLVGEDTPKDASVITPMGARAGAPLLVAHGAATGPTSDASPPGTLAEGSQLGFGGRSPSLRGGDLDSGEFFLDNTQAVPVARATYRSAMLSQPTEVPIPADETRRERRRRLGIQRRITVRVVLFALLVAAVPTGAYFAIRWYAYDNWFLSIHKHEVVVQQGHTGGVLWFQPKVVDRTGTLTSQLLATDVAQIRAGVQEPSLQAAKRYVANLHGEYVRMQEAKRAAATTTTTSTPPPGAPISPSGATTTTAIPTTATTSTPTSSAGTTAVVSTATSTTTATSTPSTPTSAVTTSTPATPAP